MVNRIMGLATLFVLLTLIGGGLTLTVYGGDLGTAFDTLLGDVNIGEAVDQYGFLIGGLSVAGKWLGAVGDLLWFENPMFEGQLGGMFRWIILLPIGIGILYGLASAWIRGVNS